MRILINYTHICIMAVDLNNCNKIFLASSILSNLYHDIEQNNIGA